MIAYLPSEISPERTVVVSCLYWARRNSEGLGDWRRFAHVIDITSLVYPEMAEQYGNFPSLPDTITEKCTVPRSFQNFRSALREQNPAAIMILRPLWRKPEMLPFLMEIAASGVPWIVCSNRSHLRHIKLSNLYRGFRGLLNSLRKPFRGASSPVFFLSNCSLTNLDAIAFFKPRHVAKVSHLDSPGGKCSKTPRHEGLFLDSFLPFHPEIRHRFGSIKAEEFYAQLETYLDLLKLRTGVEKITISKHPYSDGSESRMLKRYPISDEPTSKIIAQYDRVWSFGSGGMSLAIQLGIPAQNVVFPNLMSDEHAKICIDFSRTSGIPVACFDGKNESWLIKESLVLEVRRRLAKVYYNAGGHTVTSFLDSCSAMATPK